MGCASPQSVMIHKRPLQRSRRSTQSGFRCCPTREARQIRRFVIFNSNMAPDLRAYGVPHSVNYLVAPDGTVLHKYFVPNYCIGFPDPPWLCANSERSIPMRLSSVWKAEL